MSRRRKPQPKPRQSGLSKLMNEVRAQLPGNTKIIQRPAGESKISAVFLKFIEPFKKYADTDPAMEKLVVLGICAWNAGVVPPAERKKLIDAVMQNVLGQAGEEWRGDLNHILSSLIKRKEQHFANDQRYIVSYLLEFTAETYHLSMVSTLMPDAQDLRDRVG